MIRLAIRCHPRVPVSIDELRILPSSDGDVPDVDSLEWLQLLSGRGPERDDSLRRLHALLLRTARFELARRARGARGGAGELDDLAVQAADDALVAVLSELNAYGGESRFTTWACKFALLETAVRMRRREWHGRQLPSEEEGWARLADESSPSLDGQVETSSELIHAVRGASADVLTPDQRAVLVALALNQVPIDVLAERRGTTRAELYKTLHDSRTRLRARLAQDGFRPETLRE